MSHFAPLPNETVCWQCGALADPDACYFHRLVAASKTSPDSLGFTATRGRRTDALNLPIPRCEACQTRNWITLGLSVLAFFGCGLAAAGWFPSNGWTMVVGAFGGLLTVVLGLHVYRTLRGLRGIEDYPPLRRLRQAGWREPG